MGTITKFNIKKIIDTYNSDVFVETGTGVGYSIFSMLNTNLFKELYSCDIMTELFEPLHNQLKHLSNVHLYNTSSAEFLEIVCKLIPQEQSILFWLDAHFPGADYGLKKHDDERDATINLPLFKELEIIKNNRFGNIDVIIIDDLRIYMDGEFQSGNIPDELKCICPEIRNYDFVKEIFDTTHNITVDYDNEGYLTLFPNIINN